MLGPRLRGPLRRDTRPPALLELTRTKSTKTAFSSCPEDTTDCTAEEDEAEDDCLEGLLPDPGWAYGGAITTAVGYVAR